VAFDTSVKPGVSVTRLEEIIEAYNVQREAGEPPLTVRRLADVAEIPERTVYRHARGETAMSLDQALAYARVLKCRVEELADDRAS